MDQFQLYVLSILLDAQHRFHCFTGRGLNIFDWKMSNQMTTNTNISCFDKHRLFLMIAFSFAETSIRVACKSQVEFSSCVSDTRDPCIEAIIIKTIHREHYRGTECSYRTNRATNDHFLQEGWYTVQNENGTVLLPTRPPRRNYCSTQFPIWMNGKLICCINCNDIYSSGYLVGTVVYEER